MHLYLSPSLPPVDSLRDAKLQTPLKVYSADHKLIGEFGEKRRKPIKHHNIPQTYIDALLAAEDEGFYSHNGVSIKGLARAVSHLLITGEKKSGGSTITMQVTREFFLHRKKHFKRKFNEILLALRIEKELSKAEILELYVNMIFLGNRAYGIQAAAEIYYGKTLKELSTAQIAMIAGLQQAPSRNNPIANPEGAKKRRDWILGRMLELGTLDQETYKKATSEPVSAQYHQYQLDFSAPHIAEMARQKAVALLGPKAYTDGYIVYTSIDSNAQAQAQKAVMRGLHAYDDRHGYRGPELRLGESLTQEEQLAKLAQQPKIEGFHAALITSLSDTEIKVTLDKKVIHENSADDNAEGVGASGENVTITLNWESIRQSLRLYRTEDITETSPKTATSLFQVGDIIRLHRSEDDNSEDHISKDHSSEDHNSEDYSSENYSWTLGQLPAVQGSLISMDAFTGQVLALIGGYDFYLNNFNRVTQAQRQPGSSFKPFLYAAALDNGLTAATIINDAPVVFDDSQLEDMWRPKNSSGKFYGPTRLRKALYLSRNLVSIRILRKIGIRKAIRGMERFGIDGNALPRDLSLALGSHAMTPWDVAAGYAAFANGGYKIQPYVIDTIVDDNGKTVYSSEKVQVCATPPCKPEPPFLLKNDAFGLTEDTQNITQAAPKALHAERILSPETAYIMDSMLKDVVKRGTARKARQAIDRNDMAGKTGTTNGPTDAWFSGYAGGIVTTAWVGFDEYDKLGNREYGGSAALPIWINYMKQALENKPELIQPQPAGIVSVRINPGTGGLASSSDTNAIFEIFRTENAPTTYSAVKSGSSSISNEEEDIF